MTKIYLLFIFLSAHILTISAQRCFFNEVENSYLYVPKNGTSPAQGFIFIETDCEPMLVKKWDTYYFTSTHHEIARFSTKDTLIHLYINQKLFTGILNIAENKQYMYLLQFNEGRFEAIDTLINDDRYTIERPMKKPVLYLYPPEKQEVSVKIHLSEGKMIHQYPSYQNAWEVVASPDGTLINKATGKSHYCLFWETEGKPLVNDIKTGFVVKGEASASFLEEKLPELGLNEKEANEFIIYWLPELEQNPYNAIYFATKEYEKVSQLDIFPKPETQIRIMMVWQAWQKPKEIETQILPVKPVRKGFTVVEWGGTQIHDTFFLTNENIKTSR